MLDEKSYVKKREEGLTSNSVLETRSINDLTPNYGAVGKQQGSEVSTGCPRRLLVVDEYPAIPVQGTIN
ncbi:hypothetical protein NPIL_41841 [Nephila pilipes]|uniref:Uncharacterized protein n=1 Tax=Nephila pilipes TaxID=299642 RepID=A0A8X6NIW9_NEPPI|nr:hypothetical protein NPIL_41841 [Nephila pilipes]